MNEEEVTKIFDKLEESKPIIKSIRGINNKETYYNSDALWKILCEHEVQKR